MSNRWIVIYSGILVIELAIALAAEWKTTNDRLETRVSPTNYSDTVDRHTSIAAVSQLLTFPISQRAPTSLHAVSLPFSASFRMALQDATFVRELKDQQLFATRKYYDPLYKKMRLDPFRADILTNLLVEKQLIKSDIRTTLLDENNATDLKTIETTMRNVGSDVDARIRQLVGDDCYGLYTHFEDTVPYREAVGILRRILPAGSNLTDDQAEKLIDTWYAATPVNERKAHTGFAADVMAGITETKPVLADLPAGEPVFASTILNASQLSILKQICTLQATQRKLVKSRRHPGVQ